MGSSSPSSRRNTLLAAGFFGLMLVLSVGLFIANRQRLERAKVEEHTKVDLPVVNPKEPIDRQEHTVKLRAEQQYATINIPFDSIAMNKNGEIVGYQKREDGLVDMMLWVAGNSFDISEIAAEPFAQVLDINDNREILGVVKKEGKVYLKGYSYVVKGDQIALTPLKRIDLRSFGLEDLKIDTDLTLDSTLGQVDGRRVKVRSIIDMTDSGIVLGVPEKASPSPSPDEGNSASPSPLRP